MKPLKDTVSLTIEIPRGVYELAARNRVALKDEPGCETLNDYIESATEGDERIHQLLSKLVASSDNWANLSATLSRGDPFASGSEKVRDQ